MSTQTETKRDTRADSCCESSCCETTGDAKDVYGEALPEVERRYSTPEGKRRKREALKVQGYADEDLDSLPEAMLATTFGSGNPLAIGEIHEGDVVIDIGSGAGLDAILAARRVGSEGLVYGIDPSSRMLNRARSNARDAEAPNVHFLEGGAQKIPLPAGTADVVLSNCVLSCLGTGEASFREAYRVLKPGGRFYSTDVYPENSHSPEDALTPDTYRKRLSEAGFVDIEVTTARLSLTQSSGKGTPTVRVKASKPR